MSKFTPGPWNANEVKEGHFLIEREPEGDHKWVPIAVIDHSRDGHDLTRIVTTPANAHLIAAAPQMYEGITDAILCLRNYEDIDNNNGPNWAMRMVQELEAIIAKADGLTQTAHHAKETK